MLSGIAPGARSPPEFPPQARTLTAQVDSHAITSRDRSSCLNLAGGTRGPNLQSQLQFNCAKWDPNHSLSKHARLCYLLLLR